MKLVNTVVNESVAFCTALEDVSLVHLTGLKSLTALHLSGSSKNFTDADHARLVQLIVRFGAQVNRFIVP